MDKQFEEIKKRYDDSKINNEEVKKLCRNAIMYGIGGICLFILIMWFGFISYIMIFLSLLLIVISCCYFIESSKKRDYNHRYNYYNLLVKETLSLLYDNISFDMS